MKHFLSTLKISQVIAIALFAASQFNPFEAKAQKNNSNAVMVPAGAGNLWALAGGQTSPGDDDKMLAARGQSATPQINAAGKHKNNFTTFSNTRINKAREVASNNKGFEHHPELGMMFAEAPCNDCYELMGKRTATQKYFVKEGTD